MNRALSAGEIRAASKSTSSLLGWAAKEVKSSGKKTWSSDEVVTLLLEIKKCVQLIARTEKPKKARRG